MREGAALRDFLSKTVSTDTNTLQLETKKHTKPADIHSSSFELTNPSSHDDRLKSITRSVMSSDCPVPTESVDQSERAYSNASANRSAGRSYFDSKNRLTRSIPNWPPDLFMVSTTPSVIRTIFSPFSSEKDTAV